MKCSLFFYVAFENRCRFQEGSLTVITPDRVPQYINTCRPGMRQCGVYTVLECVVENVCALTIG